jgi:hypothetical protein
MRKHLTAAMAALTLGGAIAATATPAGAHDWDRGYHGGGYYGGGRHDRNNDGAAVAAGVVGLALGAALASGGHGYGYAYAPPYRSVYYAPDYYGPPAYRVCESERWVWDPYYRRSVPVVTRYAC